MTDPTKSKQSAAGGIATIVWACLAVVATMGAYIAVNSADGQNRLLTLVESARSALPTGTKVSVVSQVDSDFEVKLQRLTEDLEFTIADNAALRRRLATLEDSLGSVTASVAFDEAPTETAAIGSSEVAPAIDQPIADEPRGLANIAPAPEPLLANESAAAVISSTSFGLELAATLSLTDGQALWDDLKARHPDVLADLSPRISILETESGRLELRLIAGPIRNAATVAALCARLRTVGQTCNGTIFEGQSLAMR